MNQEVNRSWCCSLTKDMPLKVLLPISTFALLCGTFPTDTALLHYLEHSVGLDAASANGTLSTKTYAEISFIVPVVFLILAFSPQLVMFTGALAHLFSVLLWMQVSNFAFRQLSCVLAGYGSAAWIACSCYGRNLIPNEYYLLYYVCVGCALFVGQFLATLVDALVQTSHIDPLLPLLLAVVSSALAGFVCLVWVPVRQYPHATQDAAHPEANGPWLLCTSQYWRQIGSTLLVPIKNSPLAFLVLWFTLEYSVFQSTEATIKAFLNTSSKMGYDIGFDPLFDGHGIAYSATVGAAMTAATILLSLILSGNRTELSIAAICIFATPLVLALHYVQGQLPSVYVIYLAFIALACLQMAAGMVKITTDLSFEANVVLYGAMALMANYTKMVLTSMGLSFSLYFGLWLASSAQLWFAVAPYRGLFIPVAPPVLVPPGPNVLEDVGSAIAQSPGAVGIRSLDACAVVMIK